ncbi:MAG: PopZ family protein [Bradyrhizobium sp.]|uniref:PopZ family protein n=1 Tax=Bradyrhizobium sp. TaxID=376 RepID=UPI003D0EC602
MTQPAKVQEPSMEEILASIRRIIADDEAKPGDKPAAAAEPAPPPAKPVMKDIPPSAIPAAKLAPKAAAPAPAPKPPAPAAAPPPEPAASNSQDDIDAMLASLDTDTGAEEPEPVEAEADVFELTDEMALPDPEPVAPPATSFSKIEPPPDDLEFTEAKVVRPAPLTEPPPLEMPVAGPMLSRSTVNAVESAFNTLAHTVLSNNARTLEDLVKEMLRPMLKSWLDDNLPGLVERIVKAEIERVSRGR